MPLPQTPRAGRLPAAFASVLLAVPVLGQDNVASPAKDIIELPSFVVTTDSDRGYTPGNAVSATRIDTAIKDLPFSISAFTEQFIDDIGALELIDIVNYAPGVTSGAKEFTQGNNRYSIRGFDGDITPQRNGFSGGRYVDAGNIARVEVVKGPASLLYGQITPGGSVNYITKRPLPGNFLRLGAQVGSDDFMRVDVDGNVAVDDGRLSARVVAAHEELLAWANPSGGDAQLAAAALTWRPTDRLSITVDVEHYQRQQRPLIGMKPNMAVNVAATTANFARVADRARAQAYVDVGNLNLGFVDYAPLPADFNYVSRNDYRDSEFGNLNLEATLRLGDHWVARANAGYSDFWISNKLTGLAEFTITPAAAYLATRNRFDYVAELRADPATVLADPARTASATLTRRKRLEESMGDQRTLQAELAGRYEVGGLVLNPLFGAYYADVDTAGFRRESNANPPAGTANSATTPLQHFQPWNYNDPSTWVQDTDFDPATIANVNNFNITDGEEAAVYALLSAKLLDERLILIGGARWNKTESVGTDFRPTLATPALPASVGTPYEATKTTPQFGAGYKVTEDILLFASYSESFYIEDRSLTSFNPAYNATLPTSPTNPLTLSEPAKPVTGSGYEVGVKADLLDGRLSATASLFQLERENRVLRFRETAPDGTFPTITRQGTVDQSKGLELELTWSPMPNWQVYASFTAMDVKTTKATIPPIPTNADPVYQAAYVAAFAEAVALILDAVPEGSAEQLASLWTRYDFVDGPIKGIWIAGGFVHTGDKAQRTANPTLFLESSTIWDAVVGYDWGSGDGARWSLTASVKNVDDTEYFNANQSRGNPRRVTLGLSARF